VNGRMNLYPIENTLANGGDIANTNCIRKLYRNRDDFHNTEFNNQDVTDKNSTLFRDITYNIDHDTTNIEKNRKFSSIT